MRISESTHPQTLVLQPHEREALSEDDLSNEDYEEGILKRLSLLGERIQFLLEDIALLEKEGYLDPRYHQLSWEDIFEVSPKPDLIDGSIWAPCTAINGENSSHETEFGFYLGQQLQRLDLATNEPTDWRKIVWGIILGGLGQPEHKDLEIQRAIKDTIEFLEKKHELRSNCISSDLEIKPERVAAYVKDEKRPLPTEKLHEGHILALKEDMIEVHPLSEELEMALGVTIEEAQIHLQLEKFISLTVDQIKNTHYKNVSGNIAFQQVWEHITSDNKESLDETDLNDDDEANSSEIKKLYNSHIGRGENKVTYFGTISRIMSILSGQAPIDETPSTPGEYPGKGFDYLPVIKEKNSDSKSRGRRWKTTTYGNLVGLWMFADDGASIIREMSAEALFVSDYQLNNDDTLPEERKNIIESMRKVVKTIDHPVRYGPDNYDDVE
jgi:hypothetical protein